jgi:putative endonuclease
MVGNSQQKLGEGGEELVAVWLQKQDWLILARRWRCPHGEIDLIARCDRPLTLAFVEVKTRTPQNWDENGLLAVDQRKQEKIMTTAELFLARFPALESYPCRFDVAIVTATQKPDNQALLTQEWGSYWLNLQEYLEGAFP